MGQGFDLINYLLDILDDYENTHVNLLSTNSVIQSSSDIRFLFFFNELLLLDHIVLNIISVLYDRVHTHRVFPDC